MSSFDFFKTLSIAKTDHDMEDVFISYSGMFLLDSCTLSFKTKYEVWERTKHLIENSNISEDEKNYLLITLNKNFDVCRYNFSKLLKKRIFTFACHFCFLFVH